MSARSIHLDKVRNVRDLGGIPVFGGRVITPGLFFRGAALAGMSDLDEARLFNELGVSCVIDVRCGWEREAHPDPRIEGVENFHVPFYDNEIVGIEYTKKLPGTVRIGHDFACDSLDFYRSMANPLTAGQMRKALDIVFEHALCGKAAYEHCTGGKDRAGIIALLIELILGAGDEAVLEDYLLTNISRDAHIEKTYERFLRLCEGDEEFARRVTDAHRARPENLEAFFAGVEENFGSREAFIEKTLGFDEGRRNVLRESCTVAL